MADNLSETSINNEVNDSDNDDEDMLGDIEGLDDEEEDSNMNNAAAEEEKTNNCIWEFTHQ